MTREEARISFLKQEGWNQAQCFHLAADASFRTYDRLVQDRKSVILMNSPLSEHPDQFVFIDNLLRQAGIHAPQILASDMENGFLLLEDFGDNTFTRLLHAGSNELSLYRKGIDTLVQMQKKIRLPDNGIPLYDFNRLMNEVLLLPDWFCKHVLPQGISETARSEFIDIWTPLIEMLTRLPNTLVLLDYHADNLMITSTGECGVLDFQDARIGPVIYDLMSLLEDERRDVSATVREKLIRHYFAERPEIDSAFVRDMLPVMALQRHTKVIGIFVRLYIRDRKEKYLNMIPLVWELTERHLNNPLFADYKAWLDKYIPLDARHTVFQPQEEK